MEINHRLILHEEEYDKIWKRVLKEFSYIDNNFPFLSKSNTKKSFSKLIPKNNEKIVCYKLRRNWDYYDESVVNNFFISLSNKEIYALDWEHDCFEYNPTNLKYDFNNDNEFFEYYHYHDNDRNCEVYFPSYYPNGDYHLFISKDFSYGIIGHPWANVIYVVGDKLIELFEEKKQSLGLEEYIN